MVKLWSPLYRLAATIRPLSVGSFPAEPQTEATKKQDFSPIHPTGGMVNERKRYAVDSFGTEHSGNGQVPVELDGRLGVADWSRPAPRKLRVVAGMATMSSRVETATKAVASLIDQVDRLWIFLDRFETLPDYASHPKVRVLRSQEVGDIRGNGKMLALSQEQEDFIFLGADDDLLYPSDYVEEMCRHLAKYDYKVGIGVHSAVLKRRIKTYRGSRRVFGISAGLWWDRPVDVLGTASMAFSTRACRFDVTAWRHVNMSDLQFALHAREAGLPLVAVRRPRKWVRELARKQDDSIYIALTKNESRQTEYARKILAMPRPEAPPLGLRLRRI